MLLGYVKIFPIEPTLHRQATREDMKSHLAGYPKVFERIDLNKKVIHS